FARADERTRLHRETRPHGRRVRRARGSRGVKAVRIVVWLAGAAPCSALVLGAERGLWPPADKARIAYGTAFFGITIGVVVWQLRPDSRTGILLTAWPVTAVFADLHFVFLGSALAVTVGYAA